MQEVWIRDLKTKERWITLSKIYTLQEIPYNLGSSEYNLWLPVDLLTGVPNFTELCEGPAGRTQEIRCRTVS